MSTYHFRPSSFVFNHQCCHRDLVRRGRNQWNRLLEAKHAYETSLCGLITGTVQHLVSKEAGPDSRSEGLPKQNWFMCWSREMRRVTISLPLTLHIEAALKKREKKAFLFLHLMIK